MTAAATDSIMILFAEVAQVVEHGTENAGVDSSSLSLGTTSFPSLFSFPTEVVLGTDRSH